MWKFNDYQHQNTGVIVAETDHGEKPSVPSEIWSVIDRDIKDAEYLEEEMAGKILDL